MSHRNLPPAPTPGTWHEGDPIAFRKFVNLSAHRLENGEILPFVTFTYETWGELDEASSNAVLVLHAPTDDVHVCGEAAPGQPTPGWQEQVVGPGHVIDTDRYYAAAANVLGGCQGSTDPASSAPDGAPQGSRFPVISTRDQVYAESRLADLLGIDEWSIVAGTSLSEHRATEWTVSYPEHMCRLVVMAPGAQMTTDQAARTHTQIRAIELNPAWRSGDYYTGPGPTAGLALVHQIAYATYRFPSESDECSGRIPQNDEDPLYGGRLAVEFYLDYHGEKIVRCLDAGSYVALCCTILSRDVGRDCDGVVGALRIVTARTLIVAVNSDRLFLPEQVRQMAAGISSVFYCGIHSDHGHDDFLTEHGQLTVLLDEFLNERILLRASSFA